MIAKNIFHWDLFYLYLCGPIDFDATSGAAWRSEWTEELVEMGFNRNRIFNPCKKPVPREFFDYDNEQAIMRQLKQQEKWDDLCRVVGSFAHIDLRLLDMSGLVLANFPKVSQNGLKQLVEQFDSSYKIAYEQSELGSKPHIACMRDIFYHVLSKYVVMNIPTYGSVHEIVIARQQHKPTFIVWEGGKSSCSGWLMWLVGHQNVFESFDELKEALRRIGTGEQEYKAKDWMLFDNSV